MRRIGVTLFILIFGVIIGSWLVWYLSFERDINLLILDKTVINDNANEHRGLSWVLQQNRYVPPTGSYAPDDTYAGFRPRTDGSYEITGFESYDSTDLPEIAESYDAAYIADGYGIYEVDYYLEYPSLGPVTQPGRKIYGGLHRNDLTILQRMKDQKKLIIAEFSCFEPPTPTDVRRDMEDLLGVRWTGWNGKFFPTLDSTGNDLPDWVVSLYMEQHDGAWPFEDASGIVFTHLDERIVILRFPEDLTFPSPEVRTYAQEVNRLGTPETPTFYPYWFDIVEPDTSMQTLSYFVLPIKQEKDSLLSKYGIPRIFPAVLEQTDDRLLYYFAGDFADYPPVNMLLAQFKGIRSLRTGFYTDNDPTSRSEFYWTYYYPLVSGILQKYHTTLSR
jgi:hypothetical protein